MNKIKICGCDPKYQVPLISTFAFRGGEFWCPYCGATTGILGAGIDVKFTEKLYGRYHIYKKYSRRCLQAKSRLACIAFTNEAGVKVERKDFPEAMIEICEAEKWKYHQKTITLLKKDPPDELEFKCIQCADFMDCDRFKNGICKDWTPKNEED